MSIIGSFFKVYHLLLIRWSLSDIQQRCRRRKESTMSPLASGNLMYLSFIYGINEFPKDSLHQFAASNERLCLLFQDGDPVIMSKQQDMVDSRCCRAIELVVHV